MKSIPPNSPSPTDRYLESQRQANTPDFGHGVSRANTKQTFEFHTAWVPSAWGEEKRGCSLNLQGILGNRDTDRDEFLCWR